MGFEPMIILRLYTLSKRTDSTALALLQSVFNYNTLENNKI